MRVLVTGGTGFIGAKLCQKLLASGHQLVILTREPSDAVASFRDAQLNLGECQFIESFDDISHTAQLDAVINLAGASLADKRWTPSYKQEILSSRLQTTHALLELLKRLRDKPKVMLSASAIGYYGHHGDESLDESGATVAGFSQELCQRWEHAALEAQSLGIRVCIMRLGVVFDARGGAFVKMARPFRFGIANWVGDGRQWLSWVHRDDVVRAMQFLLERGDLEGSFNITAPNPVTHRGFCEEMVRYTRVLVTLPIPGPLLRVLLGEMAQELLLNGQRVLPKALQDAGFKFEYASLEKAIADIV